MNLRHGAVDVRQLPMELAVIFTRLIRSAGRQEMRLPGRYWRSDKMDLATCLKKMELVGVLAFCNSGQ